MESQDFNPTPSVMTNTQEMRFNISKDDFLDALNIVSKQSPINFFCTPPGVIASAASSSAAKNAANPILCNWWSMLFIPQVCQCSSRLSIKK